MFSDRIEHIPFANGAWNIPFESREDTWYQTGFDFHFLVIRLYARGIRAMISLFRGIFRGLPSANIHILSNNIQVSQNIISNVCRLPWIFTRICLNILQTSSKLSWIIDHKSQISQNIGFARISDFPNFPDFPIPISQSIRQRFRIGGNSVHICCVGFTQLCKRDFFIHIWLKTDLYMQKEWNTTRSCEMCIFNTPDLIY